MLGNNNFGFWGGGTGGGGGGGTVTAVGLCMPTAFSVANSPITSSGNICVSGAGIASQYVRGDGTLGDFPNFGGGAGSQQYYFNGSVSQGTIGGQASFQMSRTANTGAAANFSSAADGILARFITDIGSPNQTIIPAGSWFFSAYFGASSSGGTPQITATIAKWDGTTLTTIATSEAEVITNGTSIDLYNFAAAVPETSLLVTDRIVVTFNVVTDGRTITLYTQSTRLSSVTTTFVSAITSLNGLTASTQTFQVTTACTDFTITSSGCTHCFNLPTASCTNRGALSTSAFACFTNSAVHQWTDPATKLGFVTTNGFNGIGTNTTNNYSFILGGCGNNLNIGSSGGSQNCHNIVVGGNANSMCSFGAVAIFHGNILGGGFGNSINGFFNQYNIIAGGASNSLCGSCHIYNTISGGTANFICGNTSLPDCCLSNSTISGGCFNFIGGNQSVIAGGGANQNRANFSVISGGTSHIICSAFSPQSGDNLHSVIAGGDANCIFARLGCNNIGGGTLNQIVNFVDSTIGGGSQNQLLNYTSLFTTCANVIGGGRGNSMQLNAGCGDNMYFNTIAGGCLNRINDSYAGFIGGGQGNRIGQFSFGNGGLFNVISGGSSNSIICCTNSAIVGGDSNGIFQANYGFLGGGRGNMMCCSDLSTILNGCCNLINTAVFYFSFDSILNGCFNCICNPAAYSTIVNGSGNLITGCHSLAMGVNNNVSGNFSGAFGTGITACVSNTFYFCHLCLLGNFRNNGSVQLAGITNSVAGGNILYFDNSTKCVAFGGLTSGTAAPTGGNDGDIYLQYV